MNTGIASLGKATRRKVHQAVHRVQRGFALLELIIAISISAILAIYANQKLSLLAQESVAEASGYYLTLVRDAAFQHIFANYNNLANGIDVPTTAVDLRPIIAELIATNRLNAGFSAVMPTRQAVRIDLLRTGCPGAACVITGLVCTTTAVLFGGAGGNPRYDLATIMYEAQGGQGGIANINDGATIRGPFGNTPNPNGNVPATVCSTTVMNAGIFDAFVRINDVRDPALMGNLSVAGATTFTGATALGSTLNVAGAATLQNNLTVNALTALNGNTTVGGTLAVTGAATMQNNLAVTGNETVGGTLGVTGAATFANNITVAGRAAADRLTPIGQYAIGAVCAAADDGSIARVTVGSGLVVCGGGVWRPLSISATAGDACATEGMMADSAAGPKLLCVNGNYRRMNDIIRFGTPGGGCAVSGAMSIDTTNNNEALICRANLTGGGFKWMRVRDVTSHFVLVSGNIVHNNDVVSKPFCADTVANPATQVIHLLPKYTSTADGGTAVYAQDTGATWTIRMKNGAGLELSGAVTADNPTGLGTAVAQVYCYFP